MEQWSGPVERIYLAHEFAGAQGEGVLSEHSQRRSGAGYLGALKDRQEKEGWGRGGTMRS